MSLFSKVKKAKEAADKYRKSLTNKRNEKGNSKSYFTPLSKNQKKPPTKDQQVVKNKVINTRLQDVAIVAGGLVLTKAMMKDDPKIIGTASNAKEKGNKTFTYKGKKFKTPTSVPPMPKPRPKKKMYMKEGKTNKDSNVEFATGKAKKKG
jgi:hypothetical protein